MLSLSVAFAFFLSLTNTKDEKTFQIKLLTRVNDVSFIAFLFLIKVLVKL